MCDKPLVDAFIIGSRAREHLKQITKDCHIIPQDIAQISRILSSAASSNDEPSVVGEVEDPSVAGEVEEDLSAIGDATRQKMEVMELRELPVDVPDSFVGVVKQPPRYPPPAAAVMGPPQVKSPPKVHCSPTMSSHQISECLTPTFPLLS